MILGILLVESYSSIRVLADLSIYVNLYQQVSKPELEVLSFDTRRCPICHEVY
jgi:hypothetical protein